MLLGVGGVQLSQVLAQAEARVGGEAVAVDGQVNGNFVAVRVDEDEVFCHL